MYPNLKLQLWKCGIRQNRLAQLLDIHESLLSKIVNGFRQPDAHIRGRIAALLEADEVWLFTESEPRDVHDRRVLPVAGAETPKCSSGDVQTTWRPSPDGSPNSLGED